MASETPVEKIDLKWLVDKYSIDTRDIYSFADGCLSGVDSLLDEIYPAVDEQEQINDVSYDLTGLARGLMHNSQSFIMTGKFPKLLEAIDKISESESFSFYDGSNKCVTYKNLLIFKIISESSFNPKNTYPKIFENDTDREREFNFKKIIEGLKRDAYLSPSGDDSYLHVLSNNYYAFKNRNLGNKETALELFKDSLSILEGSGSDNILDKVSNDKGSMTEDEYNILRLAGDVKFNIAMSEDDYMERKRNFYDSIELREYVHSACPSYIESTSAKIALLESYATFVGDIIERNPEGDMGSFMNLYPLMHELNRSILNLSSDLSNETDFVDDVTESYKNTIRPMFDKVQSKIEELRQKDPAKKTVAEADIYNSYKEIGLRQDVIRSILTKMKNEGQFGIPEAGFIQPILYA
ncbi:MAG: hypothetical protein GQ477_05180 [Nanohaloarchaea archaeon]|nr:hypothetical protein [Candidatus Nanohaloarchaea archaeon]